MLLMEPIQAHHSSRGTNARVDYEGSALVDSVAAHVAVTLIIFIMIFYSLTKTSLLNLNINAIAIL